MSVWTNINLTSSPGVAPGIVQYYQKTLLRNVQPELVHGRDAQKKPLPPNNGKIIQFRKMTPFAASTKPLVEGVTPAGQKLTQTSFTAMVKPYGDFVPFSDELQFYHLDDMHKETAQLLSDQAMLSIDTIERDAMNAGMNVQYADGKTSRAGLAATSKLTYADIKKAVRTLKRNNCKPFPDGFYHAIVHPDTVYDLTSDAMWVDVAKYQDKQKTEKYELGTIYKVKFYESTNAKTWKDQTALFGSVAKLVIATGATMNTVERSILVTEAITADEARELTGKFVNVKYTIAGTSPDPDVDYVTPACIERVDPGAAGAAKVYFRWLPTDYASWIKTNVAEIHPSGGGASNATVYSTLVYGQNAYGDVVLDDNGRNVQVFVHLPGSAGSEDPLHQRGTISWKVNGFTCVILQDAFMVRIEHGATA